MAGRWGSLFQQAVTGLEARLDTILSEEEERFKASQAQASAAAPAPTASTPTPAPAKSSPGPSRSGSTRGTHDRLQERLARAVAAKGGAATGSKVEPSPSPSRLSFTSSPRQSLDVSSRRSTDSADPTGPSAAQNTQGPGSRRTSQDGPKRSSMDAPNSKVPEELRVEVAAHVTPKTVPEGNNCGKEESVLQAGGEAFGDREQSADSLVPAPPEDAIPAAPEAPLEDVPTSETAVDAQPGAVKQTESAALDDVQRLQQQQEEIHEYVERIDALQAKLQYLAREAAEAAKKASQAAPAGSLEKKLAEKDHQIALLMEEGKNLGVTEQKHRAIMKKLRAKIAEDEKEMNDLKAARSKADAEIEHLRRQGRRANDLEKFHEESLKRIGQLQKDINNLRSENAAKDSIISDLKSQVQKAAENAESMSARVNEEALEKERQKIRDLEDEVAALQVEKSLMTERHKAQASDLREKIERATERSRVLELECKAEVQAMEGKLEAMRVRAEETSSGALGDSQAKLLRQVETLQTQYAIASENWQGIEATLLARVAGLEKERGEALQRESDMRKKAREAAVRAKRNEEELEDARSKLPTAREDIRAYQTELETLRRRAEQAEAALLEAKAEFDKQRSAWKEEKPPSSSRERSESHGRRGWLEDMARGTNSRPESPLLSPPVRTWSSDLLGFQTISGKLRKQSAPSSNGDANTGSWDHHGHTRLAGRRPSGQPPARPSMAHSVTSGSIAGSSNQPTPASHFSATIEALGTPGLTHPLEQEETEDPAVVDAAETSSSPGQVMQDMVSVSTVAAGPSVQLVERMSAQIRRLESEKVAAKEELARISRQRDEARAEIVALMRDIEAGKSAVERVQKLEAEVAEVNARYETTLEMLGEKSELVEELKADVQDVKAMYRDLIERTLK